jgi:hypothetical protein
MPDVVNGQPSPAKPPNSTWVAIVNSFPDAAPQKSMLRSVLQGIVRNLYPIWVTPPTLSSELGTIDNDVIVSAPSQEAGASQVADDVVYPGRNLEHTYTPQVTQYTPLIPRVSDENVLYSTDVDQDILKALNPGNSQ